MSKKKQFGQFFSTKKDYILQGMIVPENVRNIIEPFCGNGDLVIQYLNDEKIKLSCFDIDPKKDYIKNRDTLLEPVNYTGKYVITNPPYLARNKSKDKTIFDLYGLNDLYKCFLQTMLNSPPIGGILILPLNFFCSIRNMDINLRKRFLNIFQILRVNIFEESVFDDTSYSVCSMQFIQRKINDTEIPFYIFPGNVKIVADLNKDNFFAIGGNIYNLPFDKVYSVSRLTLKNTENATDLFIKCIDDSAKARIKMSIRPEHYIDETKLCSARSFATLTITPPIDKEQQVKLASRFNELLEQYRDEYHSLFLSNYRESKPGLARKRISFDLVYKIIQHLLSK